LLQVPVRGGGGNGYSSATEEVLEGDKEEKVVSTFLGLARVRLGEVGRSGVFPVDIDAIEIVFLDEVGDFGGHGETVGKHNAVAEDGVGLRIVREVLAPK
jgi:hypothetical protein